MKPQIGKLYDHNPRHFKFERTCEDFEPDANEGDWVVGGISCAILGGAAFWALVWWVYSVVA